MPDIAMQVDVDAPADALYRALTTTEGIAGWWTDRNNTAGVPGNVDTFEFPGTPLTYRMRVDQAEPGKLLSWHCQAGPPAWDGTDIRWTLRPAGEGTLVVFDHTGWGEIDTMFRIVTLGWAQMIMSLKRYAETGAADPFFRN
jgi:uncharacterized protein YndB with AHSA1/START domain